MMWTCFESHTILYTAETLFPLSALFAFRPCSDFTDMLWHLVNYCFTIINIFSPSCILLWQLTWKTWSFNVFCFSLLTRFAACSWRYWFSCLTSHCRMDRVLLTWHQVYHCALPFLLSTVVTGLVVVFIYRQRAGHHACSGICYT